MVIALHCRSCLVGSVLATTGDVQPTRSTKFPSLLSFNLSLSLLLHRVVCSVVLTRLLSKVVRDDANPQ